MEEIPYTYSYYLSICNFVSHIDNQIDNIIDYYIYNDNILDDNTKNK